MTRTRLFTAALALGVYTGAIVLANHLITNGFPGATYSPYSHTYTVPVLFGLVAPAGVYVIGLSWPARNICQLAGGRGLGIVAIVGGAAISWFIANPTIAVASGGSLLVSEAVDMTAWSPLQNRINVVVAMAIASTLGAILDSVIFLSWSGIGFGPDAVILKGQIVGKLTTIVAVALPLTYVLRRQNPIRDLLPA